MKTLHHPVLRGLAATTLLALAAGAAFGQSMEYRRGYDDGYRDGMNAARTAGGGEYGRYGPRVHIERATYGVGNAYCDARPALQSRLLQGPPGSVLADNQLCGDPTPGSLKNLVVQYRCGNGPSLRVQIPENAPVTLECR